MKLFFENVAASATQVVILYIIAAVGFAADKLGLYSEKTARATTDLMFWVITPCVMVNSFLTTEFSRSAAAGFFTAFGVSFLSHLLGIAFSAPFFNKDKQNGVIYKFACTYANVGYMALPLARAVLGDEGVLYASAAVVAFNIICFIHGISLMNKGRERKFNFKALIINPGILAVAVGLPLFLTNVTLPSVISSPIGYIAQLNTPLAMIILGTYIANTEMKNIFKMKEQYLIILIRLILVPAVILCGLKLTGLAGTVAVACVISASAPSANNTVMFSAKYGRDTGIASKVVGFNTLASVFTMPLMIAAAHSLI